MSVDTQQPRAGHAGEDPTALVAWPRAANHRSACRTPLPGGAASAAAAPREGSPPT
ncbi:hypothetical protein ACLGIH_02590 [Streptomyces sp. HMX87]|uniref:hypothetical protein n=1 Tax=Streptomyces sp. HMX87 TaxID=3390849 RepID=UPI003A8C60B3